MLNPQRPDWRRYAARLLLALTLLWAMSVPQAHADIVKPVLVEISVNTNGTYRIEVRASIEAMLTGINGRYRNTKESPNAEAYDQLRVLEAPQLLEAFRQFQQEFLDAISLKFDGVEVPLRVTNVTIPEPGYTKVPRISVIVLEGEIDRSVESIVWYYPGRFGDNAVRVRQVDEENEKWYWSPWQWMRHDEASQPFSLSQVFRKQSIGSVIVTYVGAGFEHILPKGLDHILFILGIFLLSVELRSLLLQVTMFTLAHSITLSLAMLGVFTLPSSIVEPLIALSIAYIAIENIFTHKLKSSRLALVFGFGLLHGMGFASMLTDFGMPDDAFATALISFNVGVELGQLTVILIAFLLVGLWFRRKAWYHQYIVVTGSVMIAATGLYWTYDRIMI